MWPTNPQPPLLFTAGRRNPAYFVCRRISAAEFQRFLRRGSTGYGNSEPEEAEVAESQQVAQWLESPPEPEDPPAVDSIYERSLVRKRQTQERLELEVSSA